MLYFNSYNIKIFLNMHTDFSIVFKFVMVIKKKVI